MQHVNECDKNVTSSTINRRYKCDICKYATEHRWVLNNHIKNKHKKENKYNCDFCDYVASYKCNLVIHSKNIHNVVAEEKEIKCPICNYTTNKKSEYDEHTNIHVRNKKFVCDLCDYETIYKTSLVGHIINFHKPHLKKKHKILCELCEFTTNKNSNFLRHMNKHTEAKRYQCHVCGFVTIHKGNLIYHIQNIHNVPSEDVRRDYNDNTSEDAAEMNLKCDLCIFVTHSQSGLARHKTYCHNKSLDKTRRYRCAICKYETKTSNDLREHMNNHVGDNKFIYNEKHTISSHNSLEEQSKMVCDLCHFATLCKTTFDDHIKCSHSRSKIHKCQFCDFEYRLIDAYRNHVKLQHPDKFKDKKCQFCDFKTFSVNILNRHIKMKHQKGEVSTFLGIRENDPIQISVKVEEEIIEIGQTEVRDVVKSEITEVAVKNIPEGD